MKTLKSDRHMCEQLDHQCCHLSVEWSANLRSR